MNSAINFDDVSKKYKLYSKGGLYLRDRITHTLQRLNPLNGVQRTVPDAAPHKPTVRGSPLTLGSAHVLERDFWALKNVSFEIKQGESVGFIGRNGAGKSTILKLLAGVTKSTSGCINVNGRVAALIEVGAGFHPELTGRENVFLNGSILGMKRSEIEDAFNSIVSFAELEEFIDTPVKHYSSGMYVRLGFAIAAHTSPDIYLIDEVLAVGDEAFQKKCLDTLAAHKRAGKTMVLVSHNLEKVAEVCDRCIYIDHGEVKYDGLPGAAIAHYRSTVTKRGAMENAGSVPMVGCRISRLSISDGHNNSVEEVLTGDDLDIHIQYDLEGEVDDLVIGIAIHNSKGDHIMGFNTRTSSLSIKPLRGNGSVHCRIAHLPLNTGLYFVSVAIADYSCTHMYDLHNQKYQLRVINDRFMADGIIFPDPQWEGTSLVPSKTKHTTVA